MAEKIKSKSRLVTIGILLILLGIFLPDALKRTMVPHPPTILWALLIEGLKLAFFAGVACVAIGWLRNRRLKKAGRNT